MNPKLINNKSAFTKDKRVAVKSPEPVYVAVIHAIGTRISDEYGFLLEVFETEVEAQEWVDARLPDEDDDMDVEWEIFRRFVA